MLTAASEVFPYMSYRLLEMAEMIGENTLRRGFHINENGIQYGIVGNGYMMHNLYRTFNRLLNQSTLEPHTRKLYTIKADLW